MEMLGACNEAVWKKRKQQGRHKEAAEAKREALDALKEAIAIQDDVLKRLLPPAAGKGGTRPAR